MIMQNTIAQVIGCQAEEVRMKPIGYCQVKGQRFFVIADLEGQAEGLLKEGYEIVKEVFSQDGYDYETQRHDQELLRSMRLIPFTYEGRLHCLHELDYKNLIGTGFSAEEV